LWQKLDYWREGINDAFMAEKPVKLGKRLVRSGLALAACLVLLWVLLDVWGPGARVTALTHQLKAGSSLLDRLKQAVWRKVPMRWLAPRDYGRLRRRAAVELGALGPAASNAVPTLVWAIGQENTWDYETIIEEFLALGRIGLAAKRAVPDLLKSLNSPDPPGAGGSAQGTWRRGAAWALARIAPGDPRAATALVNALGQCETEDTFVYVSEDDFREPILEFWHATLRWPFMPSVKRNLIRSLGRLQPQTPETLSALFDQLDHGEYAAQATAADVLGRLRPTPDGTVGKLVDALKRAAGDRLPGDADLDAMAEAWDRHRFGARSTLFPKTKGSVFLIGPGPVERVETVFVPAPGYPGWGLRWQVIRALGRIGPSAQEALPLLWKECGDRSNMVRFAAAAAVWRISGESPELTAVFEDGWRSGDRDLREMEVTCLREMGAEFPKAVPLLSLGLRDTSTTVRRQAVSSLASLGTNALSALPALKALAKDDPGFIVRICATQAVLAVQFSNAPAAR
jgi:HEAT repeat protein